MMKKLLALLLTLMLVPSAFAESTDSISDSTYQEIRFMNAGDNVLALKKDLVAIGLLDDSALNSNVYDLATMNAIKSLQEAFALPVTGVATPEMQVICQLMVSMTNVASQTAAPTESPSPTPRPTPTATPALPNLNGLTLDEASNVVRQYGLIPEIDYEYSNTYREGVVCRYNKRNNSQRVVLYISKGPSYISAQHSTIHWFYVTGSNSDDYEFTNPYIVDGTMYIEMDVQLNSSYLFYFRGYGTACINDTFDKAVPIQVEYEKEEIRKGETQHVILKIPVNDLDVKKPTTLSVKVEMYRGKQKSTEEAIRLDFTISW